MEAAHSSAQLAGHTYGAPASTNHIAHLSGALVGVALIWLINQIPSLGDDSKSSISRKDQAQE
jgi:membrane associated rhomboid family serine protease